MPFVETRVQARLDLMQVFFDLDGTLTDSRAGIARCRQRKGELLAVLGSYKKDIVEKPGVMTTGPELPATYKPAPPLKK